MCRLQIAFFSKDVKEVFLNYKKILGQYKENNRLNFFFFFFWGFHPIFLANTWQRETLVERPTPMPVWSQTSHTICI